MHRYDICLIQFTVDVEERIKALIPLKKSCIFLRMFVLISNFWEAFLGSNFSINFLISSVFLNLKIFDLFLVLISLILGWFWYFSVILGTGSSDESEPSYYWFLGICFIGILIKYSLNVFAIRRSWEITLFSSVKVIVGVSLVLSVEKYLSVFFS